MFVSLGAVIALSSSSIAAIGFMSAEQAVDNSSVWVQNGSILAVAGATVTALAKIVPPALGLIAKAAAFFDRLERKLDEDAKRESELYANILRRQLRDDAAQADG